MKRGPASLQRRLLVATTLVLLLALVPAGWLLGALFREHAQQQFRAALQVQLDQLAGAIAFDAAGQLQVDEQRLTDPRWNRPYSGLYWQLEGPPGRATLRSRSLWDAALVLPADVPGDGAVHQHTAAGPGGAEVLVLERAIRPLQPGAPPWRASVAGSTEALDAAVAQFRLQLSLSLAVLFALLALSAWAQVVVGLAPLRALGAALDTLRAGAARRLEGRFPAEVQPLVDDLNALLARHEAVLARARQEAGNLAHALKTPLTILQQTADRLATEGAGAEAASTIEEQVAAARRQVDWHLARARAGAQPPPGAHAVPVQPLLEGLVRVVQRVHAERALQVDVAVAPGLRVAAEEHAVQEMAGNLLDNACKWARSRVRVRAGPRQVRGRGMLCIEVEDDGPGIATDALAALPARGRRLDETVAGAGLGLAIVADLAEAHGGTLALARSSLGGAAATLLLPLAQGPLSA